MSYQAMFNNFKLYWSQIAQKKSQLDTPLDSEAWPRATPKQKCKGNFEGVC